MKYTVSIEVALPREQVVALFDNAEHLPKWHRGLLRFEPLTGEPGQEGSTARFTYLMGKGTLDLVETITRRALPEELVCTYETHGVWNEVRNRFEVVDEGTTRWVSENEFRLKGLMLRLMGALMPRIFRKQSRQFMDDFKAFAEQGSDVRELAG